MPHMTVVVIERRSFVSIVLMHIFCTVVKLQLISLCAKLGPAIHCTCQDFHERVPSIIEYLKLSVCIAKFDKKQVACIIIDKPIHQ